VHCCIRTGSMVPLVLQWCHSVGSGGSRLDPVRGEAPPTGGQLVRGGCVPNTTQSLRDSVRLLHCRASGGGGKDAGHKGAPFSPRWGKVKMGCPAC